MVDSFRFLPRSFKAMYESPARVPGEDEPVWASFEKRLADSTIGLVTSAGLYCPASQACFDLDRERAEPMWGDPTWRAIPAGTPAAELAMAHLHVNDADVLADPEIALPAGLLSQLVDEGVVGGSTGEHVSVMGYQQAGLDAWRTETAPAVAARLRDHGADGVVLAPV